MCPLKLQLLSTDQDQEKGENKSKLLESRHSDDSQFLEERPNFHPPQKNLDRHP